MAWLPPRELEARFDIVLVRMPDLRLALVRCIGVVGVTLGCLGFRVQLRRARRTGLSRNGC